MTDPRAPKTNWPDRLVAVHHPEGTAALALGYRVVNAQRDFDRCRKLWNAIMSRPSAVDYRYFRESYERASDHLYALDMSYTEALADLDLIDPTLANRIDDVIWNGVPRPD